VPAGGDIPDREQNVKFGQKLDFFERMTRWADTVDRPTLIVGDFNVAPLESDVWSHKQLLKVVSHTPVEVETLQRFMDAHGWADIGRQHIAAPERYYSWWSYRSKDWKVNDRGRRLDHMWAKTEPGCRVGSSKGSPSRVPCCAMRRSCSWTRRPARSMRKANGWCRTRWSA